MLATMYPYTYSVSWLPKLLISAVTEFLGPKLNTLRPQMLDFKAISVRQLFKVFKRTDAFLSSQYALQELSSSSFYLSSNALMNIVEDLIDVYLGYIYDREIKSILIADLIRFVNSQIESQGTLDPIAVSDYVTQQTRNFGVSDKSCFFGRSMNIAVDKK
jgi:hypothetical protein